MLIVLPVLAACTGGIAEFQLYDEAFDAQFEHGSKVLDRVAQAERTVVLRREKRASASPTFSPNKAAYYLETGDPPLTGAIRASLNSVKSYNKALAGLANGEAASALAARVGTLTSNLVATAGALQIAGGGTGAFMVGGQAIIARLLPIFEQVVTIANRRAFREQLLKAYPDMRALLVKMRSGTKPMFTIIKRSYVKRGSLGGVDGIPTADLPKLEKDRQLLAGWVVLIDQSLLAMDAAAQSALSDASGPDIAALAETSIELRILAEKIRDAQSRE